MCVILKKPSNLPLPSEDILKNCFESNPDGAGFMFQRDGRVLLRKGFMTLSSLLEALKEELPPEEMLQKELIIHFRVGTHAEKTAPFTHPFPITDSEEGLKALRLRCNLAIAHNGIIHGTSKTSNLSDTQHFIRDFLFNLHLLKVDLFCERAISLISYTVGSYQKFALMSPTKVALIGPFIEHEGIFYSNTSYLPRVKATPVSRSYGPYYDDFWDFDPVTRTWKLDKKLPPIPSKKARKLLRKQALEDERDIPFFKLPAVKRITSKFEVQKELFSSLSQTPQQEPFLNGYNPKDYVI